MAVSLDPASKPRVWLIAAAVSPVAPANAIPSAISMLAGEIRRFRCSGVSRLWTRLKPKLFNRSGNLPISVAQTWETWRQKIITKAERPARRIVPWFDSRISGAFKGSIGILLGLRDGPKPALRLP